MRCQKGRALHEERRERRHCDVGDRIRRIDPPAFVGERLAALPQPADQEFQASHTHLQAHPGRLANPRSEDFERLMVVCDS